MTNKKKEATTAPQKPVEAIYKKNWAMLKEIERKKQRGLNGD